MDDLLSQAEVAERQKLFHLLRTAVKGRDVCLVEQALSGGADVNFGGPFVSSQQIGPKSCALTVFNELGTY